MSKRLWRTLVVAAVLVAALIAIVTGEVVFKWFGIGQDALMIGTCTRSAGEPSFNRIAFPATFELTDGASIAVNTKQAGAGVHEVIIAEGSEEFVVPARFSDSKWAVLVFEDDRIWVHSGDIGKFVVHKVNGAWKETWYKRARYELGFDEPACVAD